MFYCSWLLSFLYSHVLPASRGPYLPPDAVCHRHPLSQLPRGWTDVPQLKSLLTFLDLPGASTAGGPYPFTWRPGFDPR